MTETPVACRAYDAARGCTYSQGYRWQLLPCEYTRRVECPIVHAILEGKTPQESRQLPDCNELTRVRLIPLGMSPLLS